MEPVNVIVSLPDWSSLPVRLLWMVKDKLDVFDNKSFAAVCCHWRSASKSYPKTVGDGLPWITFAQPTNSLEFVNCAGERKFQVHMSPHHWVVSSKHGWILLRKDNGCGKYPLYSLFLVNFLTGAKVELPPSRGKMYPGCFTTDSNGYPQRVFTLVFEDGYSRAIIKTAYPGDKKWTDRTFEGLEGRFSNVNYFITIGDYVYSIDDKFRIMALNVADQTWKILQPPPTTRIEPQLGFIVEHDGGLIFVNCVYDDEEESSPYKFSSFELYMYNNVASSWRRMGNGEVKDTSWYYDKDRGCIATKGKGLKIIYLRQRSLQAGTPDTWVEVYNLLTGSREIRHVNYQINDVACWVDIG